MTVFDIAVIGAGAVGAACARAAARRRLQVAVFEPGPDPAAASPASAGMLAAQIEPIDEPLLALSVRGRDLYEPLAPELRETTGIDIGFWRAGIASVAFDEAATDRLKEDVARQRQAGLRCDWLDESEVRERWPGAARDCRGALFAPEDGAVDPQALTRACLADARRLGATLRVEQVTAVQTANGRVTGVVTTQGATRCSAAPWSTRGSTAASPTRASLRSSGERSDSSLRCCTRPSAACGQDSVPSPPTACRSSARTRTWSTCGTPRVTAATASCSQPSPARSSPTC